jgi:hypothetical protein
MQLIVERPAALARLRVVRCSPPRFVPSGSGAHVSRTASKAPDDARVDDLAQPPPHPERGSTAARRPRPRQPYIASLAFATPDCISCAFITAENVIFAPKPMKNGSAAGGISLESFISKKISAVRIPSSAVK